MVLSAKTTPDSWSGFLLIFFPPPAPSPPFSGRLLSKTLSTLSICSLLLLATFLLFTLSTFEPSVTAVRRHPPRRLLLFTPTSNRTPPTLTALQGMGTLYRRGTRAMPDLIVAHVSNSLNALRFRHFLRIIHSTGLLAKSDLAFVFSDDSVSSRLSPLIRHENHSLLKLLSNLNQTRHGLARYIRSEKKEPKETIWGKKKGLDSSSSSNTTSYGSIVGFDSSELDPENSLSAFLDHAPMDLRRWACYPMLLGRLKRSYKHVVLADPERVNLVTDPFTHVRTRSPESVSISSEPGIVAGGNRGVRRLTDAVLNEIVLASMEHKKKKKTSITESGILDRLRRGGHLFKNVNVFEEDSVPGGGAIDKSTRDSLWCWSDLHREVYKDCIDN